MEEEEKAEEAAGARITVRKKGKGKGGRQTKLTGGMDGGTCNSLKETRPSPFAEAVNPVIPEFCAEKKKPAGRGRVKAEPKSAEDNETASKQQKLSVEGSEKVVKKKAPADKTKKKVKVISGSESGEEEEEEVEKKSLRERIELRKTKATNYKEECVSDESEVSEGSWRSGSGGDFEFNTPPIKKAKMATTGGGKSAPAASDAGRGQTDPEPDSKVKTGLKTVKLTKPPTKPATKKATSSSGSSSEKKKRAVLGKKSHVQDWFSDDSTVDISDSDSDSPPAKKVATTEVMCRVHCVYSTLCCMTSFNSSYLILCALYRRPSHGPSVERGCNTTLYLMTQMTVISWLNN